jgi:hypothetical protein
LQLGKPAAGFGERHRVDQPRRDALDALGVAGEPGADVAEIGLCAQRLQGNPAEHQEGARSAQARRDAEKSRHAPIMAASG